MTTYMQEELEACMEEKPMNTDVRVCYDMTRYVLTRPVMGTWSEMP